MRRRLIRLALKVLRAYNRGLRGLGRWLFERSLPPHWSSRVYRRLYAAQFGADE